MRMDDSVSIGKHKAALQLQARSQVQLQAQLRCDDDVQTVILCQLTSVGLECGVPWQIDASKRGDDPYIGPSPV